jgi:D-tyrosyl-tRNA(Tyr) deacylase
MRAVVQRVSEATVTVGGLVVGAIHEPGLLVLVGVTHDDTPDRAERLAAKLWGLRILTDPSEQPRGAGESERADGSERAGVSCSDIGAPLLVISQFTLYGNTRKGRRPSWSAAAPGPIAEPLVDHVVAALRGLGARVETGEFGARMRVALVNEGPVTMIVEI